MRRVKVMTAVLLTILFGAPLIYISAESSAQGVPWWTAARTCLSQVADTTVGPEDYAIYEQFPGMDRPYTGALPWEQDPDFLARLKEQDTPVLMAAFKAVLPEPVEWEGENIALAAKQLAGTVVGPGETFSQNRALGPYTQERGYRTGPTFAGNRHITTVGGGVCKIASLLYNVATFSDLEVVRRDCHSMTVPYVPPGQDATVYYGSHDFRFLNNTKDPVVIWARRVNDTLYMAFYGRQKPPQITWRHIIRARTKYGTEYRHNPDLPPGTEKVIAPGQDGYIIKSWVVVKTPDGAVTTKKKGASFYNASPRIVERGN